MNDLLGKLDSEGKDQKVIVMLPKFKMEESIDLKEKLGLLDVKKVFSSQDADLSGLLSPSFDFPSPLFPLSNHLRALFIIRDQYIAPVEIFRMAKSASNRGKGGRHAGSRD